MKIFIYGECVSRDIFDFIDAENYDLVGYYARSSYASSFSQTPVKDIWSDNIKSNFQRRMVRTDLDKCLIDFIDAEEFDILLLDFYMERHSLFIFDDGSRCTISSELISSGFDTRKLSGRVIKPFSDEMYDLWEAGWEKFLKVVDSLDVRNKVVINKLFWAHVIENGNDFGDLFHSNSIDIVNKYLQRIYNRVSVDFKAKQFIGFDESLNIASSSHKWGLSPMHYIDEAYVEMGRKLNDIYSRLCDDSENVNVHKSTSSEPVSIKSIDDILNGRAVEGMNKVVFNDGNEVAIFLKNSHLIGASQDTNEKGRLAISFSGAVSNTSGKKGPFFSGLSISSELGIPLVAISDPTLNLCDDLPLAWYAGNEKFPNCLRSISVLVDSIAEAYNVDLVIFGGSGGGFASLAVAKNIRSKASIFVWNPQTTITKYVYTFVEQYMRVGFPSFFGEGDSGLDKINEILDTLKIDYKLKGLDYKENISIIYFQNQSDWHTNVHAVPFLRELTPLRSSDCTFVSREARNVAYFGDWGDGLAAPDTQVIKQVLLDLFSGSPPIDIERKLRLGDYFHNTPPFFEALVLDDSEWSVVSSVDKGCVECSIRFNESVNGKYQFAFYFIVDGVKNDIRGYDNLNMAVFKLPESYESIEVVGFAMDVHGNRWVNKSRLI
ncbi:DUF6270 domain-containing protein [Shewanella violacea]|uniref:Uncharacterized protein n=1 Tax=Shewanella violacea (strain JCM 10179 / CIP 106290 / LMG 19151 / DSS12) TaxID=637905 RepID=D4ZFZ4_SHEVD|nr:DUF6270 domain-containing protein [Shewanella violacea]BAJ00593.1 hypothetical protein SVI_0622 [Shewanella violacea DSS12]